MRDLDATTAREVAVEVELFLQLEGLVAGVRLATAAALVRVGTCVRAASIAVNCLILWLLKQRG